MTDHTTSENAIRLIMGLGNVGERYRDTRHNIGFSVIERVVCELATETRQESELYELTVARAGDRQILLARPKTYMNRSGLAAAALLDRFSLYPAEMLVVVDDINLPLGRLRFRPGGSDGGQNGLRSIIDLIGTQAFPRLRIGLGAPPDNVEPAEFVLSPFAPEERQIAQKTVARAAEAVIFALHHPLPGAMEQFNSLPDESA